MRLIDADELRKKIVARVVHGEDKIDRGFNLGIGAALDLLNVAPTSAQTISRGRSRHTGEGMRRASHD